jgi:hypothetical protein
MLRVPWRVFRLATETAGGTEMNRRTARSLIATVATLGIAAVIGAPAGAAVTAGAWEQYPTGGSEYQAQVLQPINTANTSNWSAKSKGGIPVMFQLSSRAAPAAFESIGSDASTANDYAYMSFTPSSALTFNQLTTLSTNYAVTTGNCHGGALRWSVRTSPTQSVFIYYGDYPNFTDCISNSQSGTNMIGLSDLRYDTSQYAGGTFYDTYAHAQTLVGTTPVTHVSLVLDGGWAGDQAMTVSNTTVNDNVYQFVSSAGGGAFSPTCNLPAATIEVSKNDPVASGDVNETTVQPSLADTGNSFRVVDCKYQYVLSIPSLSGTGTYETQIWINGVRVPTPSSPVGKVTFDLK